MRLYTKLIAHNYRQGFVITPLRALLARLACCAISARNYCLKILTRFIDPGITLHCLTDHASLCLGCPVKQTNLLMRQNIECAKAC